MNVSNLNYCRLCAALSETSEIIDLSVNLLQRNEIIEKLSIFSVNTVDFADKDLPETVCLTCRDSVRSSFDFFKKISDSQCTLKAIKNCVDMHVIYSPSEVFMDVNEVKEEKIPGKVKEETSGYRNTYLVKCNTIKTEPDDSDDIVDNQALSTNIIEASMSQTHQEKKVNNPKDITKTEPQETESDSSTDDQVSKKRTKATIEEKTCDICFKVFPYPSKLKIHRMKHTDRPRDYVCDVCGKAFYLKATLDEHKLIHNPENQACKICKKTFISIVRLNQHLKTHDVSKPFECTECQQKFRTKKMLGYHMVRHSDVFPYSCEVCKKGFRFRNCLKVHENTHTGAKPYVCTVCGMGFGNWGNCNKHMVRIHSVSLAKRVKTAHGMMPIDQETLKPKKVKPEEIDMKSEKWGEQMTKPKKRGRKVMT